ncbi:MAG: glycosyltransferase family 4 protein [Spirulina sp.]
MKALLVSQSIQGGAGRASFRLHEGLRKEGIDSCLFVQSNSTTFDNVVSQSKVLDKLSAKLKLREHLDKIPLAFYPNRDQTRPFSLQWVPNSLYSKIKFLHPDIINLHWIGHGFLPIESFGKLKAPIVWTLHDMWAFTGGCHYTGGCERYTNYCGSCPQLNSGRENDLARLIWQRKATAWKPLNITLVSPSSWLADCARNSPLFRNSHIEIIPNGLNTQVYKPLDSSFARNALNLPQDRKLLLFGSMLGTNDLRKGFHLLEPALKKLSDTEWNNRLDLVVFGGTKSQVMNEMGFNVHALGHLGDESSLALAYSAVDAFVAPSTEDNFPNTVLEALACGTPCIGFSIGGIPELIDHQKTGYLCKPFDIEDLLKGILWVLEGDDRNRLLGKMSREKVEAEFSDSRQASRYSDLFSRVLKLKNP